METVIQWTANIRRAADSSPLSDKLTDLVRTCLALFCLSPYLWDLGGEKARAQGAQPAL